jgi:hypothetical protein
MKCIKCKSKTVVSTTYQNSISITRRRRVCLSCEFRFTTREKPDAADVVRAGLDPDGPGVDRLSHAWYNNGLSTHIEDNE